MGQIRKSDITVLQGESFSQTWIAQENAHTFTLDLAGGETGTWTITVAGQTTADLAPTATAATIAAALNALARVNEQGQAGVSRASNVVTVAWPGTLTVPQSGQDRDNAVYVTPALSPQRDIAVARVVRDLTGYTGYSQARVTRGNSTATLLWDADGGTPTAALTLGGAAGTVTLTIAHSVTQAMTEGGAHDIHLVDGGGVDERFIQGAVTLDTGTTFR